MSQTLYNRHKTLLSHKKRGFIGHQKVNAALIEICALLKSVAPRDRRRPGVGSRDLGTSGQFFSCCDLL